MIRADAKNPLPPRVAAKSAALKKEDLRWDSSRGRLVNASEIDRESFKDYDPEWWYNTSKPVISLEDGVRAAIEVWAPLLNLTKAAAHYDWSKPVHELPYRWVKYDHREYVHFLPK